MFEFEIQSPRRIRVRVGRWHFRTWRSWLMRLPKGYRAPELMYVVEWRDSEGRSLGQAGAFFSEATAEACRSELDPDGRAGLVINMISLHSRLEDWQFDR